MLKPRQANTDVIKRLLRFENRVGNDIETSWSSAYSPYTETCDVVDVIRAAVHGNVNRNLREIKIHD